ncbi:unnamed protein product [Nippostrongylus brasiliensis]|uniref:Resolvase/invertase-type recombinase catalytic domain-containing protein n=1 Tax=Nippostrongylus brasiliensis TaxID=27835 RepID=A0A0N4YCS4_NIPBR|nr:unnamed protein product [Nippostrongylus brasiliensis]
MTIYTYDARTLASGASVEDLMMQARKIKYSVIGLTETRRHRPPHLRHWRRTEHATAEALVESVSSSTRTWP